MNNISPILDSINFFYGIPHTHTCFSDGEGDPFDAFSYAYSKKLDFLFISDHSNFLDGVTKKNYEYNKQEKQYCEIEGSNWYRTRIQAEYFNTLYRNFIAIRGFEMRCFTGGHLNVINSSNYLNGRKQHLSPKDLATWLQSQPRAIATINHPRAPLKKIEYSRELNNVIRLVEVGNGSAPRKYIRCEDYYYSMLDMGWKLGAVNGQDNHKANWGDSDNLTVVLAKTLSKEALLDSMFNLKTYSSETRSLKLLFLGNGKPMGSTLSLSKRETIKFIIIVEDKAVPIEKIQLLSRSGRIIMELPCNNLHSICWEIEYKPREDEGWFIVKVIHYDDRWGLSSPLFIDNIR